MVDIGISQRQAIGNLWTPKSSDLSVARAIRDGSLTLAPHRAWNFEFPIDWSADPFEQNNWKFQLHTLRWIDPIRRAAIGNNEEATEFAKLWTDIVTSWLDENLYSRSKYAWMDMADGQRTIAIVLGFPLVPDEKRAYFQNAIHRHAKHLADHRNRGHGNHELHQLAGLYVAAKFLCEQSLVTQAIKEAVDLFKNAYDDQGINEEASLGYQDLNFLWWSQLVQRFSAEGDSTSEISGILQKSRTQLVHAVRPDGTLETIGDTNPGKVLSKDTSSSTEYVRTHGRNGIPPEHRWAMWDAGYAFGRSGWGEYERDFDEETFYSARFGRNDAIHGHPDSSSITIFAGRKPWIVDPGMYAYKSSQFRRFFLSRRAHNVMHASDLVFDKTIAPELLQSFQDDSVDYYVIRDRGYSDFELTRHFVYVRSKDVFVIRDEVVKINSKARFPRFEQLWHFHPDVEVQTEKSHVQLLNAESEAHIRWLNRPGLTVAIGEESPELQGWFSNKYSSAIPAPVTKAVSSRRGIVDFVCTINSGTRVVRPIEWELGEGRNPLRSKIKIEIDAVPITIELTETGATILGAEQGSGAGHDNSKPIWTVPSNLGSASQLLPSTDDLRQHNEHIRRWVSTGESTATERRATYYMLGQLLAEKRNPATDFGTRATLVDLASSFDQSSEEVNSVFGTSRSALSIDSSSPYSLSSQGRHSTLGSFADLPNKISNDVKQEVFVSPCGGLAFPYLVSEPKVGGPLVVVFRGAVRREKTSLPHFAGAGIGHKLGVSAVVPSDPTLDLNRELTLGWYLGDMNVNLHQKLAAEIESIAGRLRSTRVILTGSSGGGFAALMTASWIKSQKTNVVAFNPQTILRHYYPSKVDSCLRAVFGIAGERAHELHAERLDVTSRIDEFGDNVAINYFQNKTDEFHIENHMRPFVEAFEKSNTASQLKVKVVDSGAGHAAPSSKEIIAQVRQILN